MALQTDGEQNQSGQNQQRAAQPQSQPQQPRAAQQQDTSGSLKSFRNLSSLGPRLGNRNLYSEYVTNTVDKLKEVIGKAIQSQEYDHDVIAMPEDANLGISVIAVTVASKTKRNLGVAYFTLLLEKTGTPLPLRTERVPTPKGEITVDVLRTTSDRYNVPMKKMVEEQLRRHYPSQKLISADGTRVPADFNPDDKIAVNELAIASYFAAGTVLTESDESFRDINLNDIARDTQLQLRPTFASTVEINAVGEPIRSDLTLNLTAQSTQTSGILGEEQINDLYKLSAIIDFLYFPSEQQGALGGFNQPQQSQILPTQKYLPRIVITKAESYGPMSLGFNLLGIAQSVALLAQRNAWMQVFLPRCGANVRDIQDVGFMNIEANIEGNQSGFGKEVDINASDFDEARMVQYLSMFTRPDVNPILSQDIPLFDPSTWYLTPLLAAAAGNPQAEKHLIKVANELTNYNFQKYFPEGSKFVVNTGEHIHLGWYVDQDGTRRDIRDIDLNAVLARQGHVDPKMGERWTETFLAVDVPEQLRLADRKKIIDGIARNATYTGYAVRISYTPVALNALAQGCRDAGLDVKNILAYANLNGTQRHRASLDSGLLAQTGSVGASFLNQGTATVNAGGFGIGTTNRWN